MKKTIVFLVLILVVTELTSQLTFRQLKGQTIGVKDKKGKFKLLYKKEELINMFMKDAALYKYDSLYEFMPVINCSLIANNGYPILLIESKKYTAYMVLNIINSKIIGGNVVCYSKKGSVCNKQCLPIGDTCPFCDSCHKLCY